jgi:hypothetical protein
MKKSIIFSSALTLLTIFSFASGIKNGNPEKSKPSQLTTLIIDANVTVVLVRNDFATAELTGGERFSKNITLRKTGDTLVIGSVRNKDLRERGIIYVSANQLMNIRINSSAYVRSFETLRNPKLDVVINGACELAISYIGDLNLSGTKSFDFESMTKTRKVPASMLNN